MNVGKMIKLNRKKNDKVVGFLNTRNSQFIGTKSQLHVSVPKRRKEYIDICKWKPLGHTVTSRNFLYCFYYP